jgi:hypothetical protein
MQQELEPTQGMVSRNQRLRVGRFDQHIVDSLTMKCSVVEHVRGGRFLFVFSVDSIKSIFIKMATLYPTHPPTKIRAHLGGMGVTGELQVCICCVLVGLFCCFLTLCFAQVRPVYTLSGGQRSRIALSLITYEVIRDVASFCQCLLALTVVAGTAPSALGRADQSSGPRHGDGVDSRSVRISRCVPACPPTCRISCVS